MPSAALFKRNPARIIRPEDGTLGEVVMKILMPILFVALFCFGSPDTSFAGVLAKIDVSEQRMKVYVDGRVRYTWKVSTGRGRYRTPRGKFGPTRMHTMWHSRKYHWAPMPHSIFFYRGYAIHGTTDIKRLGRPASHGCVRLHPDNARRLFSLVKRHGTRNTRIQIVN